MFKIALPNPNEMNAKDFFSQMRIIIKAAEKSYQELTRGLTDKELQNFFISFDHPRLWENYENKDMKVFQILDDGLDKEIELTINQV